MSGTRIEALSRMDVQNTIQRDLFAKAETHMAQCRAKASPRAGTTHMRGMQYAAHGYQVPSDSKQFLSPLTRMAVLALVVVFGAPLLAGSLG